MNFLWPHSLWLMLALPLLPALYLWLLRRRGKAALRYSSLDGRPRGIERPPLAAPRAAGIALDRVCRAAAGRCASARDGDDAVGEVDGHARHGRVAEHARERRQADAPGGGAGSGQAVPARLAQGHRGRARHLRGQRPGRPGGDAGSQRARQRHRRIPDAVRHGHRQRHRGVPGGAVSGPRHQPGRHDVRLAAESARPG